MSIEIEHRFINRLLPTETTNAVNLIIIGTFNPGLPNINKLDNTEKNEYDLISSSSKFLKFNQVKNFYDRPQNRFWKIMDYFNSPEFYSTNSIKTKNPNGLKFYKGHSREDVFKRQIEFCNKQNILITDIVRKIKPVSFNNIYDNFPDTAIEKSECVFNTQGIIEVIRKFSPEKIIINFSPNAKTIPKISEQIKKLSEHHSGRIITAISTSGAAGYDYETLIKEWIGHWF